MVTRPAQPERGLCRLGGQSVIANGLSAEMCPREDLTPLREIEPRARARSDPRPFEDDHVGKQGEGMRGRGSEGF